MSEQIRILACRVWDEYDYPPALKALWQKTVSDVFDKRGLGRPIIYPGSIVGHCQACSVRVAIGPRQQEAMKDGNPYEVYCLICAAVVSDDDREVTALGNPNDPNTGRI